MEPRRSVDLKNLPEGTAFHLQSSELQPELESRLRREEADAEHQRRKDLIILYAVLVTVGVVSVVCIIVVARSAAVDDGRWAATLLTSIVSAGLGYMTGKNSR